jgi:xylulokinase
MAVISIDLGTTGCKSAVFDGGQMLGSAYRHYNYTSSEEGWADQNPAEVWNLVNQVVKEALAAARERPTIDALCVSVQGDAIIPIDSAGNPLHPAILGMDTRSHREAADLQARFGRGQLYSATGMPCEPLNSITKILWLERHHAELKKYLWKYVHYEEFLLMKLAGIPALDFTMASRTMAFDPVRKDWVPSILEFVGLHPSQLGNVTPPGVPIGIILKAVAEEWGIDKNALVIAGAHDQCMAALGAGVMEPGLACYSMGTAEVISTCFGTPRISPSMLEANYPCYCHAVKDQFFTITLNQSGGVSLEWFHTGLLNGSELCQESYAASLALLQLAPSPVLFLPHLVGSGTPSCDRLSKASFLGLSLKTGRAELFQAVVDALAFEARLNLEKLSDLNTPISELRAVGGGARTAKILEIKATTLNRPIRTLKNPEAALLGTAMLSQTAVGVFSDLEAARDECVKIDCTVDPVQSAVGPYGEAFERYRHVYGALRSFYHNWRTECVESPVA